MPFPSKMQGSSLEGDADVSITEAMTHVSMRLISAPDNLWQGFQDPCAMSFWGICADVIQPRNDITENTAAAEAIQKHNSRINADVIVEAPRKQRVRSPDKGACAAPRTRIWRRAPGS